MASRRCRRASGPKTAAYATVNDPFTQPQIPLARKIMEAAGIKTVYSKVFPAEVTDFTPIAGQVASAHPEAVVLGSVDVPTVSAFVHTFIQQHFNPKAFIATAGPDQGADVRQGGRQGQRERDLRARTAGIGGFQKADSQQMVKEYIAKYGGTPSDVNADVAEGYAVGPGARRRPSTATHSLDNKKIIAYLHSGATLDSVQGPVKFDPPGQNTVLKALTFQWQNGKLVADAAAGRRRARQKPVYPKPAWGG